jgi:arsenate reductase (thioredoxin)
MPDIQHKTLFICLHNSARSQMAEAFPKKYGGEHFKVESAGLEPGTMNPNVVTVMQEAGIDLSQKGTQAVFGLFRPGRLYNGVITVCDEANAERCPIFPGRVKRLNWSFQDLSTFSGTHEEVLQQTREVRDEIEKTIIDFAKKADNLQFWM